VSLYTTSIQLRIDWSEIDFFGHINNLAILRYGQSARVHYLEAIGMMLPRVRPGIGPVLVSTNCQFKKQLFYPGQVTVHSGVDQVNNTSFHMRHRILDDAQEVIAELHDVLVMFDYQKNSKLTIPQEFRDRMAVAPAQGAPVPAVCP
jgi:acyl-CoA thioester hydrolase